jgi:hypothetical protein
MLPGCAPSRQNGSEKGSLKKKCHAGIKLRGTSTDNQEGEGKPHMLTLVEQSTPPKWSTAKPGTARALRETLEAFEVEDHILEYLDGYKLYPSHPAPDRSLAIATHVANVAGERYFESKPPRCAYVYRMKDADVRLASEQLARYVEAPTAEVKRVLDVLKPLSIDLQWIVAVNILQQLEARYRPTRH